MWETHTTYSGGSRYDFLSNGALDSGKVISATDLYGASKQVCLAIPVSGIAFMEKNIKACFVQVDIEGIVKGLALDSDANQTAFGLYYCNGDNLTELNFGPFGADDNLLEAMRNGMGDELLDGFNKRVEQNIKLGEVVVAAGMAELEPEDEQLYVAFHRADQRMYERKARLKELDSRVKG